VDHQHAIEAALGQPRIGGQAQPHADIVEPLAHHARRQRVANLGDDVLGDDAAFLADALAEADRVIALARADIGDGHAGLDPGEVHHLARFVEPVARFLVGPACRDDRRDGAVGGGEAGIAWSAPFARAAGVPPSHAAAAARRRPERGLTSIDILHFDRLAGHALR
jgi:hypothetical protein